MAEERVLILNENGKKKVKIQDDGYGLELYTMRNGYQWTGQGVDIEILEMMRTTISTYLDSLDT